MTDELRIAWRQWQRHPLHLAVVVALLTVGLGAAIAVFAVAYTVLWRPLDLPEPSRLVWIEGDEAGTTTTSSPGAALAFQSEARTLESLALVRPVTGALSDDSGTDRIAGALVSASMADVLGARPVLGRMIGDEDDRPGTEPVLVIAHRTWQSRYGGANDIIGRRVVLNDRAATIVGVAPPDAALLVPDAEWWAPLALPPSARTATGARYVSLVGRLAATASVESATRELTGISEQLALRGNDGRQLGVRVTPLTRQLTARYRSGLLLLLAGVVTLVVIACANVAALLLAQALARRAELALRASLGASAGRLVRQLLLEAGLLATASAAGGLIAALWIVDLLRALLPADVPRLAMVDVGGASVLFALGTALVVTIVTGLAPAVHGARTDLQTLLREAAGGRSSHDTVRRAFVAGRWHWPLCSPPPAV